MCVRICRIHGAQVDDDAERSGHHDAFRLTLDSETAIITRSNVCQRTFPNEHAAFLHLQTIFENARDTGFQPYSFWACIPERGSWFAQRR